MTSKALTAAQLAQLRKYDTPTVCNAIELFDVRPRHSGFMDARIRANAPKLPPMVGYAATATFRSADKPRGNDAYGSCMTQVERFGELPGPAVVVFQDLDNPVKAATFGEVMCSTYKAGGAVGLITSGAGRDLDQVDAIQFPTFTDGAICAHAYCHIPSIHVPVHVGGLTLYPGDLLHGDRNGVTTIPPEIADQVADGCALVMKAEQIVLDHVRSGSLSAKGFTEAAKACAAMMDEFSKKVRTRK
ncbi:MAG: RraA family protein [Phycisphaeraceae bacterium]|nr:RraA family protein [Phycisphaeraceae bacterium]